MSKSRHKKKGRNAFAAFASSQFRRRPGSRALSIQQNTPTAGRLQKRPAKAWYTPTRRAKKKQGAQHHRMGKKKSTERPGGGLPAPSFLSSFGGTMPLNGKEHSLNPITATHY